MVEKNKLIDKTKEIEELQHEIEEIKKEMASKVEEKESSDGVIMPSLNYTNFEMLSESAKLNLIYESVIGASVRIDLAIAKIDEVKKGVIG